MVGPLFISSFDSSTAEQAEQRKYQRSDPNQPWRHSCTHNHDDNNAFHLTPVRLRHEAPHTPPEAGGFHSEPSSMRLAQLPTARATRTKVLPRPCPRIQPAARQLNSKRIRRSTPPPPQGMGGTTSHRRNTHLRQMRTASHGRGPMGPRPHRQQTKLDRPGTSQLQQERRTAQSNRKRRTLDTTPSQATAATTVATNRQTTNANTARHKRIKRKRTSQTSTHNKNNKTHAKTGKNTINQPANTPRGVPRTARPRPPVRGLASSRIVQDLTDWPIP